jgi:hypothetical protein
MDGRTKESPLVWTRYHCEVRTESATPKAPACNAKPVKTYQLRLHLFKAITERNERVLCPAQSVPRLVTTVLTIPRVVGVCLVTHTCPHFQVLYGGT